jgi:hypothetical protein
MNQFLAGLSCHRPRKGRGTRLQKTQPRFSPLLISSSNKSLTEGKK